MAFIPRHINTSMSCKIVHKSLASHDFFEPIILSKGLESSLHAKTSHSSLGNEKISYLFRISQHEKTRAMSTQKAGISLVFIEHQISPFPCVLQLSSNSMVVSRIKHKKVKTKSCCLPRITSILFRTFNMVQTHRCGEQ